MIDHPAGRDPDILVSRVGDGSRSCRGTRWRAAQREQAIDPALVGTTAMRPSRKLRDRISAASPQRDEEAEGIGIIANHGWAGRVSKWWQVQANRQPVEIVGVPSSVRTCYCEAIHNGSSARIASALRLSDWAANRRWWPQCPAGGALAKKVRPTQDAISAAVSSGRRAGRCDLAALGADGRNARVKFKVSHAGAGGNVSCLTPPDKPRH